MILTSLKNRLHKKSDQNKDSKKRAVFIVLVQKQVSHGKKTTTSLDKKLQKYCWPRIQTVQTSQSSQSDELFIELEALNYELQELQENSLNLMKEKASLVSQLANPALMKQESRSHQKVKKRLKLIEKEIEELNEHIESLLSRIEKVKVPRMEASQKPIRSSIGE